MINLSSFKPSDGTWALSRTSPLPPLSDLSHRDPATSSRITSCVLLVNSDAQTSTTTVPINLRFSGSVDLRWGLDLSFLTPSQVVLMMLAPKPHFENHWENVASC